MSTFEAKKQRLLQQLAVPSETYSDASPKGAIDEEISELVYEVNALDGFVTTSSCAGRIAVYLEGPPQSHSADAHSGHARDGEPITQPSTGKGGGRWLYVSHLPLDLEANSGRGCLLSLVGLPVGAQVSVPDGSQERRLIHFKFEPMVSFKTFFRGRACFPDVAQDPPRSDFHAPTRTTNPVCSAYGWVS